MTRIAGSSFEWLEFDKEGKLLSPGAIERIRAILDASGSRDLVIMSHGWNNDRDDAWALYSQLWNSTSTSLRIGGSDPAKFMVAGILWPAIKYRAHFDLGALSDAEAAGMAQGVGSAAGEDGDGDLDERLFRQTLDDFVDLVANEAAHDARHAAIRFAATGGDAELLLAKLNEAAGDSTGDPELEAEGLPLKGQGSDVLADLAPAPSMPVDPELGGGLGIGDILQGLVQGPKAAAARLFNLFTYYTMKKRAGAVGASLGSKILPRLQSADPARLHLIGHSFGARLVTAAVHAAPDNLGTLSPYSLTLLQGAFSHNAFAAAEAHRRTGAFAGVHRKLTGPMVAMHTHNDRAVTLAYALASRLARDAAEAVGDKSDKFGAIGANGALHLDADYGDPVTIMKPGAQYQLAPRKVHNVLADACVTSHSDVVNENVGALVAAALR
jgi:hypothetical protein